MSRALALAFEPVTLQDVTEISQADGCTAWDLIHVLAVHVPVHEGLVAEHLARMVGVDVDGRVDGEGTCPLWALQSLHLPSCSTCKTIERRSCELYGAREVPACLAQDAMGNSLADGICAPRGV